MELTSAAFPGEGPIASKYTCAGPNISPPLQWTNLPAKTASLVLVMTLIDNAGSSVRWVVGNIDPSPASVAEGKTPEGGVVGVNAEGHSNYAGICPPHGQASSVQVELFALSKKLSLSEGFQLSAAEQQYSSEKLLLGVTVAKAVN
jgi:Raf kinase inhibitor-like YbhB/YbcL family protein